MAITREVVVGIDVGGTTVKGGVYVPDASSRRQPGVPLGLDPQLLFRQRVPTGTSNGEQTFAAIAQCITDVKNAVAAHNSMRRDERIEIGAYGLGAHGPLKQNGVEANSPFLGFTRFPLRARLESMLTEDAARRANAGVPVDIDVTKPPLLIIENDANAAALGAWTFGGGEPGKSMFLCTVSTGVGGGFVTADGTLYSGETGNGFEFGHGPFAPLPGEGMEIRPCGYGDPHNSCVESFISGTAIKNRFRVENPLTTPRWVRKRVAEELGVNLATVVQNLDTHHIVLMGSVAEGFQAMDVEAKLKEEDRFLAIVERTVRQRSLVHAQDVRVALSPLREDTGIWGAVALAHDALASRALENPAIAQGGFRPSVWSSEGVGLDVVFSSAGPLG